MKIGEVENLTGVAAATIRYWEDRGCISSARADNKYRNYTDDDVALIIKIKQFREIGIPIADIKLWIDNVITSKKLLTEHLKLLDSNADEHARIRELTKKMLDGNEVNTDFGVFFESEDIPNGPLILGVDIGTTTISAQLFSVAEKRCVHTYCIEHNAELSVPDYPDAYALDAEKLCNIAIGLITSAIDTYSDIVSIGVTGQMHGIVCLNDDGDIISPLFTWQNQFGLRRLGDETVCEAIERISSSKIPTGYGLVTYYALREFGLLPKGTVKLSLISDVVVMKLCKKRSPLLHSTNAASLGLFELKTNQFNTEQLKLLNIDADVLPKVVSDYCIVGDFNGIKVSVSIGDNQAGVYSSITDNSVLLNIGTSGQICAIVNEPEFDKFQDIASVEIRPFFENKHLYTGATLSGGKSIAVLCDLVAEIGRLLGTLVKKPDIYKLLNEATENAKGELTVSTKFLGTRDCPDTKGSINGITLKNLNIAELSYGFFKGIITELHDLYIMFGQKDLDRLVISGNALRKNTALQKAAEEIFKCQAATPDYTEEAALGAALFGGVSCGIISENDINRIVKADES